MIIFLYDGDLPIQHRDGDNQPLFCLTRGLDLSGSLQGAGGIGGLLAATQPSTSGPQHFYYHADAGGNVTALVNDHQVLVGRYLYDAFGNMLAINGPKADANLYRFSSKPTHALSGNYDFGRRWYAPALQRWINRDPIGELGGINLYGFVGNKPVDLVDPLGLAWSDDLGGWAESQHQQFSEAMLETSGDGNNWMIAGALNTVSELAAGMLSYPQALSQLGTGSGTFAGDPTLENSAGLALDVAMTADVLAAGIAPLPSANKPLLKPKPCPPKSPPKPSPKFQTPTKRPHGDLIKDFNANPSNWKRIKIQVSQTTRRGQEGGANVESIWRNQQTGETLATHEAFGPSGKSIHPENPSSNLPGGGSIRPGGYSRIEP